MKPTLSMQDATESRTFRYSIVDRSGDSCARVTFRDAEGCYMPDTYLNGRPVYIGDICYEGVDSFIEDACYADTLEDLDCGELADLSEQESEYVYSRATEHYGYGPK